MSLPSQRAMPRDLSSAASDLTGALERLHCAADELVQAGRQGWADRIDGAVGECEAVARAIDQEARRAAS